MQITQDGTFGEEVNPIIEEINTNNKLPGRNIIRILTFEGSVDTSNLQNVNNYVPLLPYVSKIVKYTAAIEERVTTGDVQNALSLARKRSKTRNKKRGKRHTKKRTQRGGTKFSDFAIYATDERTAQLIMENIEITETPLPSLTYE